MARKKYSEMTTIELADRLLKGRTWEEAEEVGVEILARCCALHVHVRNDGEKWFSDVMEKIANRTCEWSHEHAFELACAKGGYERQQKELHNNNK